MPLFQVAIIKKPSKKDEENGIEDGLLLEPTWVMAKDDKGAAMRAMFKINATAKIDEKDLASAEVLVRPF